MITCNVKGVTHHVEPTGKSHRLCGFIQLRTALQHLSAYSFRFTARNLDVLGQPHSSLHPCLPLQQADQLSAKVAWHQIANRQNQPVRKVDHSS